MSVFATGLGAPECPVLLPDGSLLCVEMAPGRGGVTQISADGAEARPIVRAGRPNGIAVDADGVLWIAETHPEPALLRATFDGDVEVASRGPRGEPFLFPNDLCLAPDGSLFMTDSGIRFDVWAPGGSLSSRWSELEIDGRVYRIDPRDGSIEKLDSGLRFANGISIAGDHVYANEMVSGMVYRYALAGGSREAVGGVIDPESEEGLGPTRFRGPDGQAHAADGRLYVTVFGQRHICVLEQDGSVAARIPTEGLLPSNAAFGPPGSGRLFVTEVELGRIEVFDVGVDGA